MTRFRLHTVAVLAAVLGIVVLGAGGARADDYSGETYGDAAGQISDAGKTAVVSTRSGDTLPQDECIVTHSQTAPWVKGDSFTPVTNAMLLDLNCNAKVATAKSPGNSAASPEGRAAVEEAKQAASSNNEASNGAPSNNAASSAKKQ
ncbi:hypothetical protein [Mycobacterium sp. 1164985.4]|uniref:hypothetical protein n=1 Tax=Mycobacterium sp. 1164985.4 TaxID=1834069 RepID=UPI0007FFC2F3|nr:hypothetical protein [Mycobacterium sp. 1164985.4]OBK77053.1 hypothetical protein A5650_00440 [Mycobacterium sp. 1164985.4]